MDGDVTVSEGISLTVEPGVMVQGEQLSHLEVLGHLEATGTVFEVFMLVIIK